MSAVAGALVRRWLQLLDQLADTLRRRRRLEKEGTVYAPGRGRSPDLAKRQKRQASPT